VKTDLFGEAMELVHTSDIVILVVGKDAEWESETSDQLSMNLPGESNRLIAAVLAANLNTVLVNQTGSPILMPWIDKAFTIIQVSFLFLILDDSMLECWTDISSRHGTKGRNMPMPLSTSSSAKSTHAANSQSPFPADMRTTHHT